MHHEVSSGSITSTEELAQKHVRCDHFMTWYKPIKNTLYGIFIFYFHFDILTEDIRYSTKDLQSSIKDFHEQTQIYQMTVYLFLALRSAVKNKVNCVF